MAEQWADDPVGPEPPAAAPPVADQPAERPPAAHTAERQRPAVAEQPDEQPPAGPVAAAEPSTGTPTADTDTADGLSDTDDRDTAPDDTDDRGTDDRDTDPDDTDARGTDAPDTAAAGFSRRGLFSGVPLLVALVLVTVLCAGAAALFRGQAARAGDDSGAGNLAIVDTAATSEVVGQVSDAIETVLSYDHTRLDENEAAGRAVVTGRYADEFTRTFADVRRTAPEQKLGLTTTVLLAGVTLIEGGRAEVIATMDLAAVRDTTPYNSPGRVKVVANRVDGRWKIAEMTLL